MSKKKKMVDPDPAEDQFESLPDNILSLDDMDFDDDWDDDDDYVENMFPDLN